MTLDAVAHQLAALEGRVERDFPLARLTTYRLGGPAALYAEPATTADLELLGSVLSRHSAEGAIPVLALGRGSNVVVADKGWPGVVVRLGAAFSWIRRRGATGLVAGGSTSLPLLANWSARRGLSGVEFLTAIPGSVGGAVRMNAGAHGGQVSDCLESAVVFNLESLSLFERNRAALDLDYRRSNLTERDLVTEARFELRPDEIDAIKRRLDSYRRHRSETQPGAVQNAGSVFKNPPGDAAGRLVEAAGLKGFRVGGAAVSELHANFFVAGSGATAQDVFDLVHEVRARVQEAFGIELQPEVRFVGSFRDHPAGRRDGPEVGVTADE